MRDFVNSLRTSLAGLAIALALLLPASQAGAQTVTPLPVYTDNQPGNVRDLGNGPLELRVLGGNGQIFVMSSSGVGGTSALALYPSGAATTLILLATPLSPPCVGCILSGTGIPSGATVLAYDGGTRITVAGGVILAATPQTISWGAACPASVGSNPVMLVQSGVGADLPLYTQARVCASGQNAAGATLLPFAIGAH